MSLGTLKWLAIVLPLLFLGAVDALRYALFQDQVYRPTGLAFFFGILIVAISVFSYGVFALVGKLQGHVLRQNERLAVLNHVAVAAANTPGLSPLLETVLEELLAVLRADAGLICSVDRATREHSALVARGFSPELVRRINRVKLGDDPIAEEVVRTGRPVVMERVFEDPRVMEMAIREDIRSAVSAPLKSHGEVTGILAMATRRERRFTASDLELLTSVGSQLGMAIRNASLFEKSVRRNREMETLLTISRAVNSSLALPQVLDRALDAILEVTSAEAAEIWLAEEGKELALKRHRGAAPEAFHDRTRFRIGEGFPGLVARALAPQVFHDLSGDPRFLQRSVQETGFQTYCGLPLLRREKLLGVLGVAARADNALTKPHELRLLVGIGEVISIGIENARLYERVQDAAVLEERERIAREMHDGLAQVLGYINAQSLAIGKHLTSGRTEAAREGLTQMAEAVQQVYADVREAILGLRTSPRSPGALLPSLRDYLRSYREMTGLEVQMRATSDAEAVRLPSGTEIQVMRIVQEALSNVRKHARASAVTVMFTVNDGAARVMVVDDGRGFDPGQLPPRSWPRFGLQTMRERAEAVGGIFQIESSPGQGTRVSIQLPFATKEELHACPAG